MHNASQRQLPESSCLFVVPSDLRKTQVFADGNRGFRFETQGAMGLQTEIRLEKYSYLVYDG